MLAGQLICTPVDVLADPLALAIDLTASANPLMEVYADCESIKERLQIQVLILRLCQGVSDYEGATF